MAADAGEGSYDHTDRLPATMGPDQSIEKCPKESFSLKFQQAVDFIQQQYSLDVDFEQVPLVYSLLLIDVVIQPIRLGAGD
jgi:hypothetical protein